MTAEYLYHVTDGDRLGSVLERGLVPSTGANSSLAGETGSCVYLCDGAQAAAWAAVLGKDTFLRADMRGLPEPSRRDYFGMSEYLYPDRIPPERLSVAECRLDAGDAARLCSDYVMMASETAVDLFRLLDRKDPDGGLVSDMKRTVSNLADILPRLPWEHADPKSIVRALKTEGDEGEYTMCDMFKNTGKKFWELLDDPAVPGGPGLVRELKTRLGRRFEKLCTGGWDGYDED